MMNRLTFLATIILASAQSLTAQRELYHSVGMNAGIVINPEANMGFSATIFGYSPRYHFHYFSEELSLSLNPSLGLGIATSTQDRVTVGFELPVTVDLNYGFGASMQSENRRGGAIGLGWAFNNASTTFDDLGPDLRRVNRGVFGPCLMLCARSLGMFEGSPGQFGFYTIWDVFNGNRLFGVRYVVDFGYKEFY